MFKVKTINLAISITLCGGVGASVAQDIQDAATDKPPQELFEVIQVTANRTVSDASKTPVAVTSMGEEALRSGGVTNPTALGDVIPNVSIDLVKRLYSLSKVSKSVGTDHCNKKDKLCF